MLNELNFTLYHKGRLCIVTAAPYLLPKKDGKPISFNTTLNGKSIGDIHCNDDRWENEHITDNELVYKIGSYIHSTYTSI